MPPNPYRRQPNINDMMYPKGSKQPRQVWAAVMNVYKAPDTSPIPPVSPTPTPSITPTNTQTPTPSITPTQTITPTNTGTPTQTPTNTGTPTNTPTNTGSPTPTPTKSAPFCRTFTGTGGSPAYNNFQYSRCSDGAITSSGCVGNGCNVGPICVRTSYPVVVVSGAGSISYGGSCS
jgi:hypothetical protein